MEKKITGTMAPVIPILLATAIYCTITLNDVC